MTEYTQPDFLKDEKDAENRVRAEAAWSAVFGKSMFAVPPAEKTDGSAPLSALTEAPQQDRLLGVTATGGKIFLRADGMIEEREGDGARSVGYTVAGATGDYDGNGVRDTLEKGITIDVEGFTNVGDDFRYKVARGKDGRREIHFRLKHHDDPHHPGHDAMDHCAPHVIDLRHMDPATKKADAEILAKLRERAKHDSELKSALDEGGRIVVEPDKPAPAAPSLSDLKDIALRDPHLKSIFDTDAPKADAPRVSPAQQLMNKGPKPPAPKPSP